jgi:competence protein ComEA
MPERQVDPNRAEIDELRELPGIGPGLAKRIVAGRPFHAPEDLLEVPGLGQATLQRISAQLSFEEQLEPAAQREVKPEANGRRPGLWMAIAVGAVSTLCSVSLSLAILLGINRTLDFGRSGALEDLSGQVRALQTDLGAVSIELQALRQRVEVMEGISGRMTEVETQLSRLQEQNAEALSAVQGMQAQVSAALAETRAQVAQVNRFQAFLEGLQQLLTPDQRGP